MNLETLLNGIHVLDKHNVEGIEIKGVKYDSRSVNEGDLFVAVKGFSVDGHKYIKSALDKGARAVIIEDKSYCSSLYPWVLVENSRMSLADLSACFFDYPARKFVLIGVTGTNGKTTTTNLIAKILEDQGKKVGLIGTIHNRIDKKIFPVERTTPESSDLQELFSQMVLEKVDYVIMEVSSHALDLMRVRGLEFDIAIFTNLTQDHLDYHITMKNYFEAKAKLFKGLYDKQFKKHEKIAIINGDDSWGQKLLEQCKDKAISYGVDNEVDLHAKDIEITPKGVNYKLLSKEVNLKLTGKFNVYNSLAALAVAKVEGIPLEKAIQSIDNLSGVPGRFQLVENDKNYSVIVDYAHTPDSLVNILETAKEFVKGRIITVFGCGGDRDRTKRPLMGKAAANYSDFCIVTSDNPRTEDPTKIIEDIVPGVKEVITEEKYEVVPNRKDAIAFAIKMANEEDIVIIAGKGHETYQEINGKKYPFDDKEIAGEILENINCD